MKKVSNKPLQLRVKCWIEIDGVKFFGPGRVELLQGILDHGSITKAARGMKMSYKKAWAMIDEMNSMAKNPYVITSKGGSHGGGAEVTEAGKKAVASCNKFNNKRIVLMKAETALLAI